MIYETLDEDDGLKDRIIGELRKERDHHRKGKGELERELRKIQELVHDLIRQLHQLQPGGNLKPLGDGEFSFLASRFMLLVSLLDIFLAVTMQPECKM